MYHSALPLILALALSGCQPAVPAAPAITSLKKELVTKTGNTPPSKGKGICWAEDVTPAIIETVTEQVLLRPEIRGPDGAILRAAVFQSEAAQRIVQDRRAVWFRAPCSDFQEPASAAILPRPPVEG